MQQKYDWVLGLPSSYNIELHITMALPLPQSCIGHRIMLIFLVLFMNIILIKMYPYRVSIGLISCSSPPTAVTYCQASPNFMAFLKTNFTVLKEKGHLFTNWHFLLMSSSPPSDIKSVINTFFVIPIVVPACSTVKFITGTETPIWCRPRQSPAIHLDGKPPQGQRLEDEGQKPNIQSHPGIMSI